MKAGQWEVAPLVGIYGGDGYDILNGIKWINLESSFGMVKKEKSSFEGLFLGI